MRPYTSGFARCIGLDLVIDHDVYILALHAFEESVMLQMAGFLQSHPRTSGLSLRARSSRWYLFSSHGPTTAFTA